MFSPISLLPAEVWSLVFAHLSLEDSLRVRATCRVFKELVDRSTVWRNCTVELKGNYDKDFWCTIRCWRVSSACLSAPQNWRSIAKELPGLASLTLNCQCDVKALRIFPNLKRLYIPDPASHRILYEQLCLLPPQLTHLSVCQPMWCLNRIFLPPNVPDRGLPFTNLRSFVCHCVFESSPVDALYFILSCLPQLEYLSLAPGHMNGLTDDGGIPDLRPLHNCALVSLELVECEMEKIPTDFHELLSALPSLRSLAIHCCEEYDEWHEETEKLSIWLNALPTLSSLLVRGVQVSGFVWSIPLSVNRLVLMPERIRVIEMKLLSSRLPNLLHLHLEPHRLFLGTKTASIPQIFPGLRSLRILFETRKQTLSIFKRRSPRRQKLTDRTFLSLASLKNLELLELQDEELPPAPLVSTLRGLTHNRVHICLKPEKDQLQKTCRCMNYIGCVTSNTWATE